MTRLGDGPGVEIRTSLRRTSRHPRGRSLDASRAARTNAALGPPGARLQFDVSWRDGDAGLLDLRARASYLRADTLLPFAGLLPQQDVRERLQEVAPTGEWIDTQVATGAQRRRRSLASAGPGEIPRCRLCPRWAVRRACAASPARLAAPKRRAALPSTAARPFCWPVQFSQPMDLVNFKTTLYWKRTARNCWSRRPMR